MPARRRPSAQRARHQRVAASSQLRWGWGGSAVRKVGPHENERLRPCQRAQARSAQRTRGISERGWGPARMNRMTASGSFRAQRVGGLILVVAAIATLGAPILAPHTPEDRFPGLL